MGAKGSSLCWMGTTLLCVFWPHHDVAHGHVLWIYDVLDRMVGRGDVLLVLSDGWVVPNFVYWMEAPEKDKNGEARRSWYVIFFPPRQNEVLSRL